MEKKRKKKKQNVFAQLCENIIYMIVDFIGADITAAIELLILFIFLITKDKFHWHFGMALHIYMIPMLIGGHWRYFFLGWQENEIGGILEKANLIAMRADSSNPLYAKGHFRKNYDKNPDSKMAKLKGNYFCQLVAIMQIIVMVIRILYIAVISAKQKKMGIIYNTVWPDIVIFVWVAANVGLSMGFNIYYRSILRQEKKKNIAYLLKEKEICQKVIANDDYKVFFYKNYLGRHYRMVTIIEYFEDHFSGNLKVKQTFSGRKTDNLWFEVVEDKENYKIQILIQYFCSKLNRKNIDELNEAIHKELDPVIRSKEISFGIPCVTYIIYVEEISDAFVEMFCGEVQQRKGFFCLPMGIVLNSGELYIPGMQKGHGYEEYLNMKSVILDVLKTIPEEEY